MTPLYELLYLKTNKIAIQKIKSKEIKCFFLKKIESCKKYKDRI